jgi:hypothetical protein
MFNTLTLFARSYVNGRRIARASKLQIRANRLRKQAEQLESQVGQELDGLTIGREAYKKYVAHLKERCVTGLIDLYAKVDSAVMVELGVELANDVEKSVLDVV